MHGITLMHTHTQVGTTSTARQLSPWSTSTHVRCGWPLTSATLLTKTLTALSCAHAMTAIGKHVNLDGLELYVTGAGSSAILLIPDIFGLLPQVSWKFGIMYWSCGPPRPSCSTVLLSAHGIVTFCDIQRCTLFAMSCTSSVP